MPDDARVLVAVPNQQWVHTQVAVALIRFARAKGVVIMLPNHRPVENNRNVIVQEFLKGPYQWLFMMDDDNPPINDPLELIQYDKDVMILPTPIWHNRREDLQKAKPMFLLNALDQMGQGYVAHAPQQGLQQVDSGGTGCLLIHRRVLEKFREEKVIPFERYVDEEGIVVLGSDLSFCEKVKEQGFTIWAHYDYPCMHYKEVELLTAYRVSNQRDIVCANAPNMNTPEYWDEQWATRPERNYPYYDKIIELCAGKKVLDFGCGRGDLLAKLGDRASGLDISKKAVEVCLGRGLMAEQGSEIVGGYDVIVATELLEHVDEDEELLNTFFEHTDRVIYAVPHNCLPPGLEPEHRRVYTLEYCQRITPHFKRSWNYYDYLLVLAERNGTGG